MLDYNKMRILLSKGLNEEAKSQILELSDNDTLYEFKKYFSDNEIPKIKE